MRSTMLLVLAMLLIAGCTAPAPTEDGTDRSPQLHLIALDGRAPIDAARASALLASARGPAANGTAILGESFASRVFDHIALDAGAARAFNVTAPAAGDAIATRAGGLRIGDTLELRSHAWPTPYVATYFEMERTPPCERRPGARLCFLPELEHGEARLQLIAGDGARDAAFLPDLVELGPTARPAYWNGSFDGPDGSVANFTASALAEGPLMPAEFLGAMAPGAWTVRFRLEANGELAPSGAAGIVRIREPGYLWFDDRLQAIAKPEEQARAVLANATPTSATVRIVDIADDLPAGADLLLALDDARALAGGAEATALIVTFTPEQRAIFDATPRPGGLEQALRARPIPSGLADAPASRALIFAAPHDIDITELPSVDGAEAPGLALASRPGIGEPARANGTPITGDTILLAHAGGKVPWGLPPGGRWMSTADALENLSRSRTLVLGSDDILVATYATLRVEIGEGNATRSMVAVGSVTDGPSRALWASAALASSTTQPVAPRIIVALEPGADRDAVAARLVEAWSPFGVALDR